MTPMPLIERSVEWPGVLHADAPQAIGRRSIEMSCRRVVPPGERQAHTDIDCEQ